MQARESNAQTNVPRPPPAHNQTTAHHKNTVSAQQGEGRGLPLPTQPMREHLRTGTGHEINTDHFNSMPSANARSSAVHSTGPSTSANTNTNPAYAFCDVTEHLSTGSSQYHSVVDHERTRSTGSDAGSMPVSPVATQDHALHHSAMGHDQEWSVAMAAAWEAGRNHVQQRNHLNSVRCATTNDSAASGESEASKAEQQVRVNLCCFQCKVKYIASGFLCSST